VTSTKAHLATMESGRHELLERQLELEESLEEAHDDLKATNKEHGAAPLGYPAHHCLILSQDHRLHVNLYLNFCSHRNAESESEGFV
jgi:hypothetical protein